MTAPTHPPPPGLPTRRAARDLLTATLEQRRPLEEALEALPARLDPRDRAAAHRIAATVLRRLGSLDEILAPFLRKEPPPPARHALRIGAAELLLLGTPPHAAVATAVALAPRAFAGLVNAVLRKVAAEGAAALEGLDAARLDTPPWLWASWHAAYGPAVRAIAEAHRAPAPLDLTPAPGASPPEGAEVLPTGSWRLSAGTRVTDLPGFAEGRFWVQDAAAALPALLLAPRPGERIADLCAAPGGKTAQLAAAGAEVTAVERDARRLDRLRENLARLRLRATIVQADAAAWTPDAPFDAILLDAPCTATGTIRRHPDVAHAKRPRDVPAAAEAQARLLAAAARMLRPGGRLVFATCSLQPEEGEAHLPRAAALGLVHKPFLPAELPGLPEAITPAGCLRTRPDFWAGRGGMDGFFAARFRRP
ncbi:methyltransferase domain-containing protein [Roseomonas alkaliterrae]|uniref:16S rRNA (Cytosine967-C5)-methyltransferase n=1 Tax=Neoroseomonas alkaliterrae TaxID=1452450 RepID=A0A840Y2A1_9PROT|nr:transcription antitermination factor NusB [Neoroseomonas alkaliterrae]MBB5688363.1 16S rRNA (cytosine967-C5)-methyltransferase [Neoroseomonas alkaliterrae]MBR0676428.1 methyltransferase domain-containing protein [Neoroseomonas alkaliterrae]